MNAVAKLAATGELADRLLELADGPDEEFDAAWSEFVAAKEAERAGTPRRKPTRRSAIARVRSVLALHMRGVDIERLERLVLVAERIAAKNAAKNTHARRCVLGVAA